MFQRIFASCVSEDMDTRFTQNVANSDRTGLPIIRIVTILRARSCIPLPRVPLASTNHFWRRCVTPRRNVRRAQRSARCPCACCPPVASGPRRARQCVLLAATATVLAAGCDRPAEAGRYAGIPSVVGDTLRFPDGSEYVSGFTGVEYIGSIPAATKAPFIIIAGHECDDCDAP